MVILEMFLYINQILQPLLFNEKLRSVVGVEEGAALSPCFFLKHFAHELLLSES